MSAFFGSVGVRVGSSRRATIEIGLGIQNHEPANKSVFPARFENPGGHKHWAVQGFSLIDLMIAITILGIIIAVAVPNFQKFRARAKQASAKTLLSGYSIAQKASFSEYLIYPGNLPGSGYQPTGTVGYRIQAATNPAANALPGYTATCIATNSTAANCPAGFIRWQEDGAAVDAPAAACTPEVTGVLGTGGGFRACATSAIGGAVEDVWAVDDSGRICNGFGNCQATGGGAAVSGQSGLN